MATNTPPETDALSAALLDLADARDEYEAAFAALDPKLIHRENPQSVRDAWSAACSRHDAAVSRLIVLGRSLRTRRAAA